jgi:hypothetical protein
LLSDMLKVLKFSKSQKLFFFIRSSQNIGPIVSKMAATGSLNRPQNEAQPVMRLSCDRNKMVAPVSTMCFSDVPGRSSGFNYWFFSDAPGRRRL